MRHVDGSGGFLVRLADGCEHAGAAFLLFLRGWLGVVTPQHPTRATGRIVHQLYFQIVKSLLVVGVVGTFMGMILALQVGEEIARYGGEGQLGNIVGASLAREMGPFIAAIILAATVGSAIAAELGTMRVSEEIDALELMNVDPVRFLVAPRLVAATIAAVILTILVDAVGICGGAVVAQAQFGTTFRDYFDGVRNVFASETLFGVLPRDVYTGLIKAAVFGTMIGTISCTAGMRASGGALGVGRAVRGAVIASVVMTLVVGYLVTWVFWA